jgi:hypothetical protein
MFRGILKRALPPTLQWRALSGRSLPRAPQTVPLSVLDAMREDMKAQRTAHRAALAAQRDEYYASLTAQRDDFYANLAAQREFAKYNRESHESLCALRYTNLHYSLTEQLAVALRDADVASERASARSLLAKAINGCWCQWEMFARTLVMLDNSGWNSANTQQLLDQLRLTGMPKRPCTLSQQLQDLLRTPGVAAYLQVAERDNSLAPGVLAKSAAAVLLALWTPLHSPGGEGTRRPLPQEVFEAVGVNGLIAFAALLRLSGRNVSLYGPGGDYATAMLRLPPVDMFRATEEDIVASQRFEVGASVDLLSAVGELARWPEP